MSGRRSQPQNLLLRNRSSPGRVILMERPPTGRDATMLRNLAAMPLLALLASGCAANAEPDTTRDIAQQTRSTASSPAPTTPAPAGTTRPTRRLDHVPHSTRPDCSDGLVTRIIPGHSGWRSLDQATTGLLRHPGADHAAMPPVDDGRVTIVLYRRDDTTKATARLSRLHNRWFPDSIALCRSTLT